MKMVFNSSLPRSGSTLLQQLLAQHASNHCTPTSDLIELIVQLRNSYGKFDAFQSQGAMSVAPRIRSAIRGLIEGYYRDELAAGQTVFEKSRGWIAYTELIEDVLERPVKVICCVRDVREVVASFERLYRTNQLTKADVGGDAYFECQTIDGRARQLLGSGAVVGLAINRIRDAFDRGLADRIVIVRNRDLVAMPQEEILRISMAVGSTPFLCDPNNVRQVTQEDDSVHGMKLHDVRPVVSSEGCTRWQDYLPQHVGDWIHESYPFMQQLAGVETEESAQESRRPPYMQRVNKHDRDLVPQ